MLQSARTSQWAIALTGLTTTLYCCIGTCRAAESVDLDDFNPHDMNQLLDADPTLLHTLGESCDDPVTLESDLTRRMYEVPRLPWDSPCVGVRLRRRLPVVILEADLVPTAVKWTPTYLAKHWPADTMLKALETTRVGARGNPIFEYRTRAPKEEYNRGHFVVDEDQTVLVALPMKEFLARAAAGAGSSAPPLYSQGERVDPAIYSAEMQADVYQWRWGRVNALHQTALWGVKSRTEMPQYVYLGGNNATTPLHYDRGENLLVQVHGTKEVHLWDPAHWRSLVPFPVSHPSFQGSTIDDIHQTTSPTSPALAATEAHRAHIGPGDVLYIPMHWWHNTEAGPERHGMSVSFYRPQATLDPVSEESIQHKIASLIAMEAMAAHLLGPQTYAPAMAQIRFLIDTGGGVEAAISAALTKPEKDELWRRWGKLAQSGGWDLDEAVKWLAGPGRFKTPQLPGSAEVPLHHSYLNGDQRKAPDADAEVHTEL